jgi:hypothetical protein
MNNHEIRARIEVRLRKILDIYSQAQSIGDFKDAVLAVHTAIDDAINLELTPEERKEPFSKKVERFYPELHSFYHIGEVTLLRNEIAHPVRVFREEEVRQAARAFVDFASAAWPNLFESPPPYIHHPDPTPYAHFDHPLPPPPPLIFPDEPVSSLEDIESIPPEPASALAPEKKMANTPARLALPDGLRDMLHLPWHHLMFCFASAWMGIMLIGLMVHLSTTSPTTTLLALGLGMLIFFIASLGYLVHFLLRLGIKRTFGAILTILVMTTLIFSVRQPSGTRWDTRLVDGFGAALTTPFFWVSQIGQLAYENGREFGQRYFKESAAGDIGEPADEFVFDRDMDILFPPTEQPDGPVLAATPTSQTTASGISVGGRVRIQTNGTRLNAREAPGLGGVVVTMFEPGTIVQVLDGPVDSDGYTWWKVESGDQVGWSASDFMTPVE